MKEKDFQSRFTAWIKQNRRNGSFMESTAWELKLKQRGERLNFKNDIRPQQLPALAQARNSCVFYKLSDLDIGAKPFDCMQICFADSFLVVGYYTKPSAISVYFLDPIILLSLVERGTKSIDEVYCIQHTCKEIYII